MMPSWSDGIYRSAYFKDPHKQDPMQDPHFALKELPAQRDRFLSQLLVTGNRRFELSETFLESHNKKWLEANFSKILEIIFPELMSAIEKEKDAVLVEIASYRENSPIVLFEVSGDKIFVYADALGVSEDFISDLQGIGQDIKKRLEVYQNKESRQASVFEDSLSFSNGSWFKEGGLYVNNVLQCYFSPKENKLQLNSEHGCFSPGCSESFFFFISAIISKVLPSLISKRHPFSKKNFLSNKNLVCYNSNNEPLIRFKVDNSAKLEEVYTDLSGQTNKEIPFTIIKTIINCVKKIANLNQYNWVIVHPNFFLGLRRTHQGQSIVQISFREPKHHFSAADIEKTYYLAGSCDQCLVYSNHDSVNRENHFSKNGLEYRCSIENLKGLPQGLPQAFTQVFTISLENALKDTLSSVIEIINQLKKIPSIKECAWKITKKDGSEFFSYSKNGKWNAYWYLSGQEVLNEVILTFIRDSVPDLFQKVTIYEKKSDESLLACIDFQQANQERKAGIKALIYSTPKDLVPLLKGLLKSFKHEHLSSEIPWSVVVQERGKKPLAGLHCDWEITLTMELSDENEKELLEKLKKTPFTGLRVQAIFKTDAENSEQARSGLLERDAWQPCYRSLECAQPENLSVSLDNPPRLSSL